MGIVLDLEKEITLVPVHFMIAQQGLPEQGDILVVDLSVGKELLPQFPIVII